MNIENLEKVIELKRELDEEEHLKKNVENQKIFSILVNHNYIRLSELETKVVKSMVIGRCNTNIDNIKASLDAL